jgi:hypothetical protein
MNVVRVDPPAVRDQEALTKLSHLLDTAQRDLEKLTTDPIVIAASPNRFNDIYWSDWRAVRFGAFFTERHDYGGPRDYERELADASDGARSARDVLERLEAAGWRDLFLNAFAFSWNDQILALVLQDGLPWLIFSSSNATDENHVFALWDEDRPLLYFGECLERFDWDLQDSPPLRFQEKLQS